MQYSKIFLAILLPSALALPSTHGHLHKHEHNPNDPGVVSGAPFSSGTGGPFSMSNVTASAAGTGTGSAANQYSTIYTTIQSTVYLTAPASAASAAAIESAPIEAGSSAAGNCDAPVTVTYNPTVTVTVTTNGGSSDESGVQPAPIDSASSAAVASASSEPMYSETHAPDQSVAPVASSPAAAPVTAQAPVSSKAASPVPLEPSVAPVQSVVASPVGLSPQPINASPSAAASSPAAAATSNTVAPVTGGSAKSKRGIAFVANATPGSEADQLTKYANSYADKISWLGNFFCGPPPGLSPQIEYIPQMYGLKSEADWNKYGKEEYSKGVTHMFSFGEPETDNEALYQNAKTASDNWMKWMEPFAGNVTIGAPAVLQGGDDNKYLEAFLGYCADQKPNKCTLGFVALHWVYTADLGNVQGVKDAVQAAITTANTYNPKLPVWLDNLQAGGTSDQQIAFLKEIVPWLESQPEVQRYGYLPPALGNKDGYATFLNSDGSPSELAKFYATM